MQNFLRLPGNTIKKDATDGIGINPKDRSLLISKCLMKPKCVYLPLEEIHGLY